MWAVYVLMGTACPIGDFFARDLDRAPGAAPHQEEPGFFGRQCGKR